VREAVLLVNVGSPDAPTRAAVARYLRQFLLDPRVIDLPWLLRWLLVNLVIVPLRASRVARAYARAWTPRGAPLVVHTADLAAAMGARFAMRYGWPSIESVLAELGPIDRLVLLPLYPQYAEATTGSAVAEVRRILAPGVELRVLDPFGWNPQYLDVLVEAARPAWETARADVLVLSFHGLPERHVQRACPKFGPPGCCDGEIPAHCYRAQCVATARGLASRLGAARWELAFQSRVGRDRWLSPSTIEVLDRLRAEGVRRIAVGCPSFVVDCLETTIEIGEEARGRWVAAGGDAFTLLPCPNESAGPRALHPALDYSTATSTSSSVSGTLSGPSE
jgi:ferrochelatase